MIARGNLLILNLTQFYHESLYSLILICPGYPLTGPTTPVIPYFYVKDIYNPWFIISLRKCPSERSSLSERGIGGFLEFSLLKP